MTPSATPPKQTAPPAPLRLDNLAFWQLSGLLICGLLPTSLAAFLSDVKLMEFFGLALGLVPVTALIGFLVGTVIGIRDRRPSRWSRPK
jgi:hypothetical protein